MIRRGRSDDWRIEQSRYDSAGANELAAARAHGLARGGVDLAPEFRAPYKVYDAWIRKGVRPGDIVLELGSGSGRHTVTLTESGAFVVALDVSLTSLQACSVRTAGLSVPVCGNIERLPLADSTVDVVACAGSLSYGEPSRVNGEVFRVLRPGGSLILVDSLNHNAAYRLNRWIHYRRGDRTASTLERMPTVARISDLVANFDEFSFYTHGSYLYLQPILKRILGEDRALRFDAALESRWPSKRGAFKFVVWARGYRGEVGSRSLSTGGSGDRRDSPPSNERDGR